MIRYLRLYIHFLRFSFSKALQFRLDFTFRIFMDVAYHLLNLAFFKILYTHTQLIAGWTEDQMVVFICTYILHDGLYMTFFANNCWWFPIYINRGDLDYYLTKPVSPLFFLSLREFAANSLVNLIFGIGIFIWSLTQLVNPIDVTRLLFFIFFILNGTLIYYMLTILFYLPVFWTQSPRGFMDLIYGLEGMVKYPDGIQSWGFRFIFTVLIPINLICSFPARVFFDEDPLLIGASILGISAIFWIFYLWIWRKAIRQYSSASS